MPTFNPAEPTTLGVSEERHPLPPDSPLTVTLHYLDESGPESELTGPQIAPKPTLRTAKTRVYQLRLTPDQWAELTRKAMFERLTVADYIRLCCGI